ncbi:hypothetical protein [Xylanimonas ulmi]|uniref:Uncharacterized protein n=1 Tax=Xylanimonas ulmi TaxID=228973 RepID=A0A4Q7M4F9_9MICO|nr:hypothetical protein [Xylanibacterium ulmi]RZS62464.1 hypothetical protein EV386_2797 [Xylanibacterium ulmi]
MTERDGQWDWDALAAKTSDLSDPAVMDAAWSAEADRQATLRAEALEARDDPADRAAAQALAAERGVPAPWPAQPSGPAYTSAEADEMLDDMKADH